MKAFYDEISLMDTNYFSDRNFFKITVENPDYYSIYMESIDKIKYNYGIDNKHTLVQKQLGATIKTTFIDTLTKIYEADEFDTSIFSDFDKMFIKNMFEQNNYNIFRNTCVELDLLELQGYFKYLHQNEFSLKLSNTLLKFVSYKSEKYGNKNYYRINTEIIKRFYIDDFEISANQLEIDNLKDYILQSHKIKFQISDQFISHILYGYSNFINGNMVRLYKNIQAIRLVNILQFNRFNQIKEKSPKVKINLENQTEMRPLTFCRKLSTKKNDIEDLIKEVKEKETIRIIKDYSYSNKCFNIELIPISEKEKALFLASIHFI